MSREDRRAAATAYKERAVPAGVYAVRCGEAVFVGATPTLDTIDNRLGFSLRQGGHTCRALQAAYATHGAYSFEPLETAPQDLTPVGRSAWLKERVAHWRETLGAATI